MQILASELQSGDVWLGENGIELTVANAHPAPQQRYIPYGASQTTPSVPMIPTQIFGILRRPAHESFEGTWTLQPDMPIEVRRGN